MLPAISQSYHAGILLLDFKNAELSLERLSYTMREIDLLEDGSAKTVELKPGLEWFLSVGNGIASIKIYSESLNKEVKTEKEVPKNSLRFQKKISSKKSIVVSKEGGKIVFSVKKNN